MIRAVDSKGVLIIGIPRRTLETLLKSERGCISEPQAPDDCPVVVRIYCGETDEEIVAKMSADYGKHPEEIFDNRHKRGSPS